MLLKIAAIAMLMLSIADFAIYVTGFNAPHTVITRHFDH